MVRPTQGVSLVQLELAGHLWFRVFAAGGQPLDVDVLPD